MTDPLGYDAALDMSQAANAAAAADHYYRESRDLDETVRRQQNELHQHRAHYPHAHVDHRTDGWHASIDTFDERTGMHHTEAIFTTVGQAWAWLQRTWAVIA